MKKILSLLAMLVVTVAAMATDYTDKLVNSVYGYEASYETATLQVTDKGDGKYDVVLKDLANSAVGYQLGDLTLSDVEGTTSGGVTTISVTDVTAKFTSGDWVATSPGCPMTSVTVKFNDTKAYANYDGKVALNSYGQWPFTATFGTDDFATEPEPEAVTVPYTDVAYATFAGNTVNYTDHEVDVITETDGTTTIVYKQLTAGTSVFGDLTAKNVTATTAEDGTVTYAFNGDATWSNTTGTFSMFGITDGATVGLTIDGTAKDGKLNATFVTTLMGSEATIVFGSSYVEPEPEPETLPLENFVPDGATFQYPFAINWDNQKLVATLDLSTCHEQQANENLFSLSDNVDVLSNWNPTDDGFLSLYYTRNATLWTSSGWQDAEKRLTVHYRGAANANVEVTINNPEEVVFEVTKEGLYAEGSLIMPASDMPLLYESNPANLYFASIQGENRSWATYKSVNVVDLEVAVPDTITYTDVAYTTYAGTTTDYDSNKVEIVSETDGTTTIIYRGVTVGDNVLGDLTAKNVTATENEDGTTTYEFTGEATWSNTDGTFESFGVVDGATVDLTINGTAKDLDFDATFVTTIASREATIVFGSSSIVPEDGVEVIPSGYAPDGEKFAYTADIDWDKQYLKAVIDLSTCTGSNEGILSVGQSISQWSGAPHFHLYYPVSNTKGNLEINYLDASSSPVRGHVNASGEVTIVISKRTGITINDVNGNILYEDNGTFSSRDSISSIYADLWALTNIEVGSQEGSGRSHATYKSVRIYDLEEEVPVVVSEETYTDKLVFSDSEGNSQTLNNAEVVLRQYDDDTYEIVIKDFGYGDISVKPVTVETEDGVTYITGETTVEVGGNDYVVAVDGLKSSDDKLVLSFEFSDPDDEEFSIVGQFGSVVDGIGGIENTVKGADAIYTISGAKVNSLQKGINIVRVNGKTIKVVKK